MFKANKINLRKAGVDFKDVIGVSVFGSGAKVELRLVQLKDGRNVKVQQLWFNSKIVPVESMRDSSGWALRYTAEVLG